MDAINDTREQLLARNRRLQYATIAWNLMEVVVTVGLGISAASLALIAFGLVSLVEVFASVVAIWSIEKHEQRRARRALQLVGIAFAVLAVYLTAASLYNLVQRDAADSSPFGIAYLAATACVMFGLARTKRKLATAARSEPLAAEARMTLLDGYLASGILIALVLNAVWGLWWADPAAALLVAALCVREALANWRESRDESGAEVAI